jgi:hypothetical protein
MKGGEKRDKSFQNTPGCCGAESFASLRFDNKGTTILGFALHNKPERR